MKAVQMGEECWFKNANHLNTDEWAGCNNFRADLTCTTAVYCKATPTGHHLQWFKIGRCGSVKVLQRAILQQQSASRKWVSWSNSFLPCGLCEPSQTNVEHWVITVMIFFFSVLEIAMKFGHPSITLWILSLFGHCLEPQSQLSLSNVLGFV